MKDVLFICLGNVSRSQMAEAFYNHPVKKDGAISAGAEPPSAYKHPSEKNIRAMKEEGVDISRQKVKKLQPAMVRRALKVISFCEKEALPEYALQHPYVTFWKVDDPHFLDLDGRRKVRDAIKKNILSLRDSA